MKFAKELTTRQWKLYSFLKGQTEYKHVYQVLVESELYGQEFNSKNFNNSTAARALRKDLQALKASGAIQTVLATHTKKGIKIATKEEYASYSKRKWKAIVEAIKMQKLQDKKAGLDGQHRIVFNKEKEVIEAFIG